MKIYVLQSLTLSFSCFHDRGFVKYSRSKVKYRPPKQRMKDWNEIYYSKGKTELKVQAARWVYTQELYQFQSMIHEPAK